MDTKKKESTRMIKFVLFSISAGAIEIITFSLLDTLTDWPYWPCYLIALVLSVLWNFTLNREFTFKAANNVPIAMLKVAGYYAVFTPLTTILGNYLAENLGWNGFVVTLINMALNLTTEYIFDRFVVYGKAVDTNKRAAQEEAGTQQMADTQPAAGTQQVSGTQNVSSDAKENSASEK
ncbi:MAG: GtrA family protein [Lachnospiraceae bacterium]|jgi:putative flippase GtrA|nr:GtrA family protein [Lachnospiraceae bacterium]